jgi:hypothetical protein
VSTLSNTILGIPTISNVSNLYSSNIINAGNGVISGTSIFNSNIEIYNSIPSYPLYVIGDIHLSGQLRINGVPLASNSNMTSTNIII